MISARSVRISVLALGAVVLFGGFGVAADAPTIEGSYKVVKRVLPDGSEVTPPDIVGLMTFTGEYRNFNIRWGDAESPTSISYVAKYRLTATEYCEEPLYWMSNNLVEPGIEYDAPAEKSECSKVTHADGGIEFPLHGEPVVARFEGATMTATAEGEFVDHWKRVE